MINNDIPSVDSFVWVSFCLSCFLVVLISSWKLKDLTTKSHEPAITKEH